MRVRPVPDTTPAVMAVVIEEHARTDENTIDRRQGAIEHHVAIIDDPFGDKRRDSLTNP